MNYHNWLGIFQLMYLKNGKNTTHGACESKSVSLIIVCCNILTGDGKRHEEKP